jgi:hypothetical protein
VTVESFGFGKEIGIREKAVHDSNSIVPVEGGYKYIPGFFNCFHVPWGDISASAYQAEIQRMI